MASLNTQTAPDPMASNIFALVWAALQNTYEGTNVPRTVSRLLHSYQPEDGIIAYERLLRKLYVLLKDFETNGFQILVSIIPPPTNVLDTKIQEVFQKSTGFSKIIPSLYQTYLNSSNKVDSNVQMNKTKIKPKRIQIVRFVPKKNKASEKSNGSIQKPSDSDEFRGFPSNEISTTKMHIQNVNQFHEPTSENYVSQSYHTCNRNTSQTAEKTQDQQDENSGDPLITIQTVDQKHLEIPMSQENQSETTEHYCTVQECLIKKDQAHINSVTTEEEVLNTEKMDSRSEKDLTNKDFQETNKDSSEKIEEQNLNFEIPKIQEPKESNEDEDFLEKELKIMQRAIQEDIYKMDVIQSLQTDFVKTKWLTIPQYKDLEAEDLEVNKDLKTSIQNFLMRVNKPSASTSSEPKYSTKATQTILKGETSAFMDCWEKIMREVLHAEQELSSSDSNKNSDLSKENNVQTENASTLKQDNEKKAFMQKPNPATKSKSEGGAQKTPNQSQNDEIVQSKELALEELNLRLQRKRCIVNSIKMLQQANSISHLLNHRRQYYAALMNIQRAKVALTNSVTISSTGITNDYNPYYQKFLQYKQQLMEHEQLLLKTQLSNQKPRRTVPNNNQRSTTVSPNSNKRRHPSFGQPRIPNKTPAASSAKKPSVFSFFAQDTVTGEIRHYGTNECDQPTPNMKKKKLEKIVGNLKKAKSVSKPQSSSPH